MQNKRFLCLVLTLALLVGMPLPTALCATKTAVVTQSGTKMRASAKASSKVLYTLSKGTSVTVLATSDGVARIRYNNRTGYVSKSRLKLADADVQPGAPDLSEDARTLQQAATVYKKASVSSKKLAQLKKGTSVTLLESKNGWSRIRYDGKTGYIKNTAFSAATPSPAATPTPTPTPAPTPSTASGRTAQTQLAARLYQKASRSSASRKVAAGTTLTILNQSGDWYRVRKGDVTGYMLRSAFTAAATETPVPGPTASPAYNALQSGSHGAAVTQLQKRLEALGYLDALPNGKYGSYTALAVKHFQSAAGLKASGAADAQTQQKLYASSAPISPMLSLTLKSGSSGSYVKRIQLRLKSKKYYSGKITGNYTDAVADAVRAFQRAIGITADGIAGPSTLKRLYRSDAPEASATAAPSPTATPTPTAVSTATPKPSATPRPTPAPSNNKSKVETVIAAAMAKLGKPYVYGATGPNSYDCSGFTRYAFQTVGISLPHSAYSQGYASGTKVVLSQLQRGDLVCFNTISDSDLSDHVGIYLGNNQFIHASSGQAKVVISSLASGYYKTAFSWGRSLL